MVFKPSDFPPKDDLGRIRSDYETPLQYMETWARRNHKHDGDDGAILSASAGAVTFLVAASDAAESSRSNSAYLCSGSFDDVVIQEAIDALPSMGGKIAFSEGTFFVSAQVNIPDNVMLQGVGPGTVFVFSADLTGSYMFSVDGTGTAKTDIVIRDFKVDCTDQDHDGAIIIDTCTRSLIENIELVGNGTDKTITTHILVQNSTDCWIRDCTSTDSGQRSFRMITNTRAEITGCVSTGAVLHAFSLSSLDESIIQGNRADSSGSQGIGLFTCTNTVASGNLCRLNDFHGIVAQDCDECLILGNISHSNSQATDDTYDNIVLTIGNTECGVISNHVRMGGQANQPSYGVNVDGNGIDLGISTNVSNYMGANDVLNGGKSGGIRNQADYTRNSSARIRNRFGSERAPLVTDDVDKNYELNSVWTNADDDLIYFCVDNAAGAAVWTPALGATGDFVLRNATLPMTADWDVGNFDLTMKSLTMDGDFLLQSATDSTTAFQIKDNDGGTNVVTVDTVNERFMVGADSASETFRVVGSTNPLCFFSNPGGVTNFQVVGSNCGVIFNPDTFNAWRFSSSGGFFNIRDNTQASNVIRIEQATSSASNELTLYVDAVGCLGVGADPASAGKFVVTASNATVGAIVKQASSGDLLHLDDDVGTVFEVDDAGHIVIGRGEAGVDYTVTFDGEDNDGVLTWMEDEDYFKFDAPGSFDGQVYLLETTTPTAIVNYGAVYTKTDNALYFQDGAGTEHTVHRDAFSSLWVHDTAATITITTQNTYTKVTIFVNEGIEDDLGNCVGDATADDDITMNVAGDYEVTLQFSGTNDGGGAAEFHLAPKIILNTPKTITDATNADPIVVTSAGHGLKTGDGVIQSGVVGNTAANGDFIITRLGVDTYSLQTTAHADVAGNGDYVSDGTVDACIPGNVYIEMLASNITLGRGAASGIVAIAAGDILEVVAVNQDGTANLAVEQMQFGVFKVGD